MKTGIGLHNTEGKVGGTFLALLASVVLSIGAEWPMGVEVRPLTVPATGSSGFTRWEPVEGGILFTNRLDDERSLTNQVFLNGSGVAAGDVDGDGACDLYFCGLDVPNALYRNLGEGRWEDITAWAGVGCADQASTGAVMADVDGDGRLDLLVTGMYRGVRLFLNQGQGRFREATDAAGLGGSGGATSMALADIDGDGWLDLYVVHYRNDTLRDQPGRRFQVGVTNGVSRLLSVDGRSVEEPDLKGRFELRSNGEILENGEADMLYRNLGGGRFEAVDWGGGGFLAEDGTVMSPPQDWGLSAMFRDVNRDGAPDLYVCNDFHSPDRFWINDGTGRFRAAGSGVLGQTSLFSMGVDFADIDRDGHDDFFVADMRSREHERRQVQVLEATGFGKSMRVDTGWPQSSRNMLYRARGDGSYAEVARWAGVAASEWSWCPAFLDVDLDGYEDLLITTGHWRDAMHGDVAAGIEDALRRRAMSPRDQLRLRRAFPRLDTADVAFRNRGDGTFETTGAVWGWTVRGVSQGMALADVDGDGDLDVVINVLNSAPLLYRNESASARLAVRLKGRGFDGQGVGSRIRVEVEGLPVQEQEVISGGRYVSGDDGGRTFAMGSEGRQARVEVRWRSGRRSEVTGVPANHELTIREPEGSEVTSGLDESVARAELGLFEDVSDRLNHEHTHQARDDFAVQPLLPWRPSERGPGVTWFDFNGDGREDLLLAGGVGGKVGVFRQDDRGGLVRQRARMFEAPLDRAMTAVLGWRPTVGQPGLIMGWAENAGESEPKPVVGQISLVTGTVDDGLIRRIGGVGPMALGDVDGDGFPDLMVGGGGLPGRYPESTSTVFFRGGPGGVWDRGVEVDSDRNGMGPLRDGLLTDLDGDGRPEWVAVYEWGPVRVFRWRAGQWQRWDRELRGQAGRLELATLEALTGWWNCVTSGDFDGDGRLDLMVGNLGRNTMRQDYLGSPVQLHYGDALGEGRYSLLESWVDPDLGQRVPVRDLRVLSEGFPALRANYPTLAAFAVATVHDLERDGLLPAARVTSVTGDSVVLMNREDHWELRSLPMEVQMAPVMGMAVGDFDGDGHMDVMLSQNRFGTSAFESRWDAGLGCLLLGDGQGGWVVEPSGRSGIRIAGEGRGVAVADFDGDGRLDVAVGQHQGRTLLYRNRNGRPGLRVRLEGKGANPDAIGARIRGVDGEGRWGPVQERRVGGGGGSQNGAVKVLTATEASPVLAVDVVWPDGIRQKHSVTPGVTEVRLRWGGDVQD
jgi:hypothetical protein